jgi:hypothetical protein
METDNKIDENGRDLFDLYGDAISAACERAVREALLKHKLAGNPIAISRDGKVVILRAEDIEVS